MRPFIISTDTAYSTLVKNNILNFEEAAYMMNISPAKYLNILNNAYVTFDNDLNPVKTDFI